VKQKGLSEAVEDFIALRAPKAVARDGKRSALSPKYVENTATWLRSFAKAFPGHKIGDLTKEHLNGYIAGFKELSAKSRNDRRAVVKLFLGWCVRNDFLTPTHRLAEAEEMRMEQWDAAPTDCYRPDELRALLENATCEMRAVVALQGLGGLRLEEALRLDWREVFTIAGHVEISTSKSKTRSRRLVENSPALEQWLAPFRGCEGRVGARWATANDYVRDFAALRNRLKIPSRKNGLRHGFCTFHFALHNNENLTVTQAGNSPAMIHAHYKGLATKAEAEKWFGIRPSAAAENVIPIPGTNIV
jgi:integrase